MKNIVKILFVVFLVSDISAQQINADFTVSNDTICQSYSIIIDATISGGDGGPYYVYRDGSLVNLPIVFFPAQSSIYNFHVTDSSGNHYYDTITVTVFSMPPCSFTSDTFQGCNPLTVTFTESSPNIGQTYFWEFGDGGTDTSKITSHIYQSPGVYDIILSVTSINACVNSDTVAGLITVTNCGTVNENEFSKTIEIFPTQTDGIFYVKILQKGNYMISVYNNAGVKIINKEYSGIISEKFDISNYSSGIYYVNVYCNNRYYTKNIFLTQ